MTQHALKSSGTLGRTLSRLIMGAAIVYAGAVGYLYFNQRNLLYPGAHDGVMVDAPEAYGARNVHDIRLTAADGQELRSWYLPPATDDAPVLMMLLGNADHLNGHMTLLSALQAKGLGALIVGYRGFNGSEGSPTEDHLYADARANLAWLQDVAGLAPQDIVVMGYSLGTGIAAKMAEEFPLKGLVLAAPYTRMVDMAQKSYPWAPASLLLKDKFNTLDRMAKIRSPLLLVMGEQDKVVPVEMGRAVLEAATGAKDSLFIPDADHMNLFDKGGNEKIVDFMLWLN